jgi:hypothetical protein
MNQAFLMRRHPPVKARAIGEVEDYPRSGAEGDRPDLITF